MVSLSLRRKSADQTDPEREKRKKSMRSFALFCQAAYGASVLKEGTFTNEIGFLTHITAVCLS